MIAGVVVLAFLVMFAYDVPFEVWTAAGRPARERWASASSAADGEQVDFLTSAVRNMLRIVDFLPLFYLVGSVSIVSTQHNQRLGDIAAGTLVDARRFGGRSRSTASRSPR